jgi:hypothetical protein
MEISEQTIKIIERLDFFALVKQSALRGNIIKRQCGLDKIYNGEILYCVYIMIIYTYPSGGGYLEGGCSQ